MNTGIRTVAVAAMMATTLGVAAPLATASEVDRQPHAATVKTMDTLESVDGVRLHGGGVHKINSGRAGVPTLTMSEVPTKEQLLAEFSEAKDGDVIFERTNGGYHVSIAKQDGKPVIQVMTANPGEVRAAAGFCHWAAMAAVFAIGSAGLAFLAASGGGLVAGIMLSARACAKLSAVLAGGGGVSALVSQYIC